MEKPKKLEDLSFENYFLDIGLYEKVIYTDKELAAKLIGDEIIIDCYCPECDRESTFKSIKRKELEVYLSNKRNAQSSPGSVSSSFPLPDIEKYVDVFLKANSYSGRSFICSRDNTHNITFYLKLTDSNIIKVGQYPSVATLQSGELKKYRKILGDDYIEFSKAVGLSAHGIGIGSYVYLRRIIERLVEETHQNLKNGPNWDEDKYKGAHFKDKINLVSSPIDSAAVKALKPLYNILGKGIHELSEDECNSYFNNLKIAIEFILDRKLEEKTREEKLKKIKSSLSEIESNV